MKKSIRLISLFLMLALLFSFLLCSCGAEDDEEDDEEEEGYEEFIEYLYDKFQYVDNPLSGTTLTVYNWGEYLSDGSEGTPDVLDIFEKYTGIKVIYSTYASNEDMYAKLKSGAISYDIIVPSDYMIGKLIEENMLEKIDMSKVPNYEEIDEAYTGLYFDPNDEYSIPYALGLVGIIYNTTMVDEEDVEDQSWSLMWNEKYTGQIISFDNARDAFGIAQFYGGIDTNSTDKADWDRAKDLMVEQRKVLQGYVMDEIFQTMEGGNAAISAYYAGDCLSMMYENEDLAFYYPKEGTNIYVDSLCVPKGCKNYDAAMMFLNFMCDPDIATATANYICYATPIPAVLENDYYDYPEGTDEYEILYNVSADYIANKTWYYETMPNEIITYYNKLFDEVKANSEGQTFYLAVLPVSFVALIAIIVTMTVLDKKKNADDVKKKKKQ